MEGIKPRDLNIETVYFPQEPKIKEALESYANGETPKIMVFINGRSSSKGPLRLLLECEALGGIIVGDYGQTVLTRVINESDIEGLLQLEEQITAFIPEGVTYKPFLKDEKFFMKLPTKDERYRFELLPDTKPSQIEKSPFHQNAQVVVHCQPNVWINFDTLQAGLFLNLFKVVVDGGKRIGRKR